MRQGSGRLRRHPLISHNQGVNSRIINLATLGSFTFVLGVDHWRSRHFPCPTAGPSVSFTAPPLQLSDERLCEFRGRRTSPHPVDLPWSASPGARAKLWTTSIRIAFRSGKFCRIGCMTEDRPGATQRSRSGAWLEAVSRLVIGADHAVPPVTLSEPKGNADSAFLRRRAAGLYSPKWPLLRGRRSESKE